MREGTALLWVASRPGVSLDLLRTFSRQFLFLSFTLKYLKLFVKVSMKLINDKWVYCIKWRFSFLNRNLENILSLFYRISPFVIAVMIQYRHKCDICHVCLYEISAFRNSFIWLSMELMFWLCSESGCNKYMIHASWSYAQHLINKTMDLSFHYIRTKWVGYIT